MRIDSLNFLFVDGLAPVGAFFQKNVFSSRNQKVVVVAAAIFAAIAIGIVAKRYFFKASKTPPKKSVVSTPTGISAASATSIPVAKLSSFLAVSDSAERVVEEHEKEVARFKEKFNEIRSALETAKDEEKTTVVDATSTTITMGLELDEDGLLHGEGTRARLDAMGSVILEVGTFKSGDFVSGDRFFVSQALLTEDPDSIYTRGNHKDGLLEDEAGVKCTADRLLSGVFKSGRLTSGKITTRRADSVIVAKGTFEEEELVKGAKTIFFRDETPAITETVSADE